MSFFRFCLILVSLSVFAGSLNAGVWKQTSKDFFSPFTEEYSTVFYSSMAANGAFYFAFKDSAIADFQETISTTRPLGKTSEYFDKAGRLYPNLLYMGAMYTDYLFRGDEKSISSANYMFRATLHACLFTNILKYTVREKRPNPSTNRASFPSGHTTSIFAFATVIHQEHGLYWGVPAYAIAAIGGFSRINDNAHYIQDVIAGAIIGITYGLSIKKLDKKASENTTLIAPLVDGDKFGMFMQRRF